jgi:y4mF family transcriptional regulator
MRIDSSEDLGRYVRERRRALGMTQTDLTVVARVSRRWLSDLEAGKATVEIGLVMKTLSALDLVLEVSPYEPGPNHVDLNELLRGFGSRRD